MPRDSGGTYTLPSGNPVVSGTVIESVWANDTMEDIAVQMNNVITRDGLLGPIQPFLIVDGTVALPGIAFALATSTGLYRFAPNTVGMSIAGVLKQAWNSTGSGVVGDFDITGNTAMGGNLDLNGTIDVAGNAVFSGTVNITGLLTLTGNVSVGGSLTIGTSIAAGGQISNIGNVNGFFGYTATNISAGTGAYAGLTATNDTGLSSQFVMSSSIYTGIAMAGANAAIIYNPNSGGVNLVAGHASGPIRFATGGVAEKMRLTSTGRLGQGTASPSYTYHQVSTAPGIVQISSYPGAGNTPAIGNFLAGAINSSATEVALAGMQIAFTRIADTDYSSTLLFYTSADNTPIERMRIASNGNVGIGTVTASWKLSIGEYSDIVANEIHVRNPTASLGLMTLDNNAAGVMCLINNNSGSAFIGVPSTAVGLAANAAAAMVFAMAGVNRVQLANTGELGIACAPLGSVMLQVKVGTNQNFGVLTQGGFASLVGLTDAGSSTRLRVVGNPLVFSGNGSADQVYIDSTGLMTMVNGFLSQAVSSVSYSAAATNAIFHVNNTNTTAGSGARLQIGTAGTSAAADPHIYFIIPGLFDWSAGINNVDLTFNIKVGSALSGASGFRISTGAICQSVQGGVAYPMAVDPGGTAASIPVGAIVFGQAVISAGGAALSGLGTFVCGTAGQQISWGPYTGGATTTTITSGTWRNIGAQTVGGVGLFMRVA